MEFAKVIWSDWRQSNYSFYLDYGYADEDVMEDQIYVLPEESIKYPPIQAQKLVIEGK